MYAVLSLLPFLFLGLARSIIVLIALMVLTAAAVTICDFVAVISVVSGTVVDSRFPPSNKTSEQFLEGAEDIAEEKTIFSRFS